MAVGGATQANLIAGAGIVGNIIAAIAMLPSTVDRDRHKRKRRHKR